MQSDTLVNRLTQFIASSGLTTTQFADAAAIPRPTLSQILSGRNKKVSNEILEKLHFAFPNLDILWLLFGKRANNERVSRISQNIIDTGENLSDSILNSTDKDMKDRTISNSIVNDFEDMAIYGSSAPHTTNSFGGYDSAVYTDSNQTISNSEPAKSLNTNVNTKITNTSYPESDSSKPATITQPSFDEEVSTRTKESKIDDFTANEFSSDMACGANKRRIVSIMVFYSDNSYEVFKSDSK